MKDNTAKFQLFKNLFWSIILILDPSLTYSAVTIPDYNFTLEQLNDFLPGTSKDQVDQKNPLNSEQVKSRGNTQTYKYPISYSGYKFSVYVQYKDNVVTDIFTRLPSYFVHDLFHQSLINKYGKQDSFFNKDNSSVYIWNNANNFKHVYYGSCTITCFPVFYTIQMITMPESVSPLLKQFQIGSNFN